MGLTPNITIGVVGSPELAQTLTNLGYRIITGTDFRSAALKIKEETQASGAFPLLVVDQHPSPGIKAWVESQSRRTELFVIPGESGALADHSLALSVPESVENVLAALGIQAPLHDLAERLIVHGGAVMGRASASAGQPAAASATADLAPDLSPALAQPEEEFTEPPLPSPVMEEPDSVPTAHPGSSEQLYQAPIYKAAPERGGDGFPPTHTPQAVHQEQTGPVTPPWMTASQPEVAPAHVPTSQPVSPEPAPSVAHIPPVATPVPSAWPVEPAPTTPAPWEAQYQPTHLAQPQGPQHVHASAPGQYGHNPYAAQPARAPHYVQPSPATPGRFDFDDFSDQRSTPQQRHNQAAAGDVLVTWAAKGGVGKTSLSITIAELAAQRGMRVCVVDVNRGQTDVRKYVKVANAHLPTISDASHGNPRAAVISQETLTAARGQRGPLSFDLIQGPPSDRASKADTPAALYARVIDIIRSDYDLIVIDTQIAETEFTDLWDELLVPLMRSGAWSLGLFDGSPSAMTNLSEIQQKFAPLGVPASKQMAAASRWDEISESEAEFMRGHFERAGVTFLGSSPEDPDFHNPMFGGYPPIDAPSVTPLLNSVLYRISGRHEFAPAGAPKRRRFSSFGRRK